MEQARLLRMLKGIRRETGRLRAANVALCGREQAGEGITSETGERLCALGY